jgi:NIPSNAP
MNVKLIVSLLLVTTTMATNILKAEEERGTTESRTQATSSAIYHCIRYTIDPQKVADCEIYARRWMEGGIIKRCGGEPLGYFLPKKGYGGPDNIAMTFIGFPSLAAVEEYRKKLASDPEARENVEFARKSGCILTEDRSYFYGIFGEGK